MTAPRILASTVTALLLGGAALADPPTGARVDRGITALEAGQPVPLRNRPLPQRASPRERARGRVTPGEIVPYVEPAEYGVLLEYDGSRASLEAEGVRVASQVGHVFTARVRSEDIGRLRGLAGVRSLRLARYLRPNLNVSVPEVRADLEHAGTGTPPVYAGRAGQGILVGDVDTGIDFTRADFMDGTGKTRILYIWDQTDAAGPSPGAFGYGSEWTKAQIDDTPGSVRQVDSDGHGTNVAGVLIGNGSLTGCSQPAYRYVGMAPLAQFVEVKTDFSDTGIIDGVNYIFQKAADLGLDCVVNISLGGQAGPHDGSDVFTQSISALAGPGRIVVASAGNEEADNIHGRLTTTSTTVGVDKFTLNVPSYTRNSGTFNDYFLVAGWYDPTVSLSIRIKGPNASDTLSVGLGGARDKSTSSGKIFLVNQNVSLGFGGTATGRQFELEVYDSLQTSPPRAGTWEIDVVANGSANIGQRVDIWMYAAQLGSAGVQPAVVTGLDLSTLVGEPADGDSVFAVGAYTTKPSWYSCAAGASYTFNPPPVLGAIASFSSVGPRRDGVLKPQISAPGFGVATTHSTQAGSIVVPWDVDDGVHEITAGTSFSAPHVAGAAALFLQYLPGSGPSRVMQAFESHARADAYTGVVPNPTWGYGKLDVYGTIDHVAPSVTVTSPVGGETWKAGSSHSVTWTATDDVGVTVVDLAWSTDGGATYPDVIATGLANTGSFPWTVPDTPTGAARVRVTAHDAGGNLGVGSSAANFTIDRWTITASAGEGGTISPSGAVGVVEGGSQTFSIRPAASYHVLDVLVDGGSVGADTSYAFTNVHANHTIAASFSQTLFALTTTATRGGHVTRLPDQADFAAGTSVTLTAVPDSGWAFTGWSGDTTTTGNPLLLVMNAPHAVAAAFADTARPSVSVLAPAGGEVLGIGSTAHLAWSAVDNVGIGRVDLLLSRAGAGGPFDSIATAVPNAGSFDWVVTGPATTEAFLQVVARDSAGNAGWAVGDSAFSIQSTTGVESGPVTQLELPPIAPNPTRGAGRIAFAVPRSAAVRLSVLDVQGREVARLADGVYAPGRYQILWNGEAGVRPGLYFVRLATPERTLVRRVVVTR